VAGAVVTPGFAKPRSELPWLPYESLDRVIINAHNFTQPWTPSVNGKAASAAYVPSRDTAGNGTSAVTDFVAGANVTLFNMEAGDWVSDTDAGGVRALSFNGVNEYGDASLSVAASPNKLLSCWFRSTSMAALQFLAVADNSMLLRLQGGKLVGYCFPFVFLNGTTNYVTNTWYHAALLSTSTTLSLYLDGVLEVSSGRSGNVNASTGFRLARESSSTTTNLLTGRLDDVRLYSGESYSIADVASLYAAGAGRGIQA